MLIYALPALLLLVAAVLGLRAGAHDSPAATPARSGPLVLSPGPAPGASTSACGRLLTALPTELTAGAGTVRRLALATPSPPGTLAWGGGASDPVVLRCGVPRPAALSPTSELIDIDQVSWLVSSRPEADIFVEVDRPVYIVLTVPRGLGTGPVQTVSETIRATLARQNPF